MTDQKRSVQMVDDTILRPEDNMSNDTNAFFNSKKFQETYFFESYYYQLVTFDTSWCHDMTKWQSHITTVVDEIDHGDLANLRSFGTAVIFN